MNATAVCEPAAPAQQAAQETIVHLFINLASDEWGNELMDKIAADTFARHNRLNTGRAMLLTVIEHAGWFLDYFEHQGRVISIASANTSARHSDTVKAIWRRINAAKVVGLPGVRRDGLPVYGPEPRPAPCQNCGKCGPLHKVKYADDSGIGSMMVCPGCD